ncbi:MAG: ATP-dependent sacrificial sulfur transferase LarE [Spirochaetaceae bacterium]|nr:MAG: ATP-dependent sacrificial sulfur transferase LarE [Spirochaetaceae bacterium]
MQTAEKYNKLKEIIKNEGSLVIAFSGGVDSTFLLDTAFRVLGQEKVLAVTADSPTFPKSERDETVNFTKSHKIPHRIIFTDEAEVINNAGNTPDRCYFCKRELFSKLCKIAAQNGFHAVAEGSNTDDKSDYRPGRRAIAELGILSPLAMAGLSKAQIRELSREAGLSAWDKPAYACLTSRFPYHVEISKEALARIEQAEEFLKSLGFRQCRVRHYSELARVEVSQEMVTQAMARESVISEKLKELGYKTVEIDPTGYRTGSMNIF